MAAWPVLVFDIETVPDVAGLRLLRGAGPSSSDDEVHAQWLAERAEEGRSDFLPHYLQRVIVISCVFRDGDGLRVHSFVDHAPNGISEEGRIIGQFFRTIDKRAPQLVSWNGVGFDLPVLHYRGLRHGVVADRYWDMGQDDREYRYNNYINRYHLRHCDLMDLLAMYQPRANAPLDAMAKLCGFPGKLGMDGSQVHAAFRAGRLDEIRRYCETDVMNTYLLYCRFQKMRGGLTESDYEHEMMLVRGTLVALAATEPHWREYVDAWVGDRGG
jgi:predicted PolB exonuclease-like 3'-5' exonuclease